jgi:Chloroplast import apparatus Tic20-like
MAWRGENKIGARIWSLLPYMMPIADALPFVGAAAKVVPGLKFFVLPLYFMALPYMMVEGVFTRFFGMLGGFLVFILLFVTVVRNPRIGHFIRFNTAQAIIIGIAVAILEAVLQIFQFPLGFVPEEILANASPLDYGLAALGGAIFFIALGSVLYSIFSVVQGKYADIPVISEASYAQVR